MFQRIKRHCVAYLRALVLKKHFSMLPSPFRDAIYEGYNGKPIEYYHLYTYEGGKTAFITHFASSQCCDSLWYVRRFIRGIFSPYLVQFLSTRLFLLVTCNQMVLSDCNMLPVWNERILRYSGFLFNMRNDELCL